MAAASAAAGGRGLLRMSDSKMNFIIYTRMKLVTVLTVQRAQKAFYTAHMAQRALRSDTAADRCVNLAVHTSGKQSRIHTQPVLQVTHVGSTLLGTKIWHASGV